MIQMPHRSVTRFFIPLIDVLLLLFCIFLLMPLANEDELDDQREAASNLGDTVVYAFYQATGRPAFVFDNGTNPPLNRVVVTGTGIPADTTVIPTGNATVDVLVRTQDPNHRFEKKGASGLVVPGRIKNWRRVR